MAKSKASLAQKVFFIVAAAGVIASFKKASTDNESVNESDIKTPVA